MRFFYLLSAVFLLLTSCSEQYNISGDSSVSTLDGRMLYLKVVNGNENMRNLDSCEVVHGKFNFMGMMDSTAMGELYMDNESVMPVVIENGDISIRINNTEQRVIGGSLNNKLYHFIEEKNRLEGEIMDLSNLEARMILAGGDPNVIHCKLSGKANKLYAKIEKLETNFITSNDDNILGSTFFMLLCSQYPYPIVTAQIQQIMKKTAPSFRRLPFVRDYMHAAETNMRFIRQDKDHND